MMSRLEYQEVALVVIDPRKWTLNRHCGEEKEGLKYKNMIGKVTSR